MPVVRENDIPYAWDGKPIQIKTDVDETKLIVIMAEKAHLENQTYGINEISPHDIVISWKKKDDDFYGIRVWIHHLDVSEETMHNVPTSTDKIWTLFKLKRKLVIECNDVIVYEIHYKDLFDRESNLQRAISGWSRAVKKITFDNLDESTKFYRPAGLTFSRFFLIYLCYFAKGGFEESLAEVLTGLIGSNSLVVK